MTLLPAGKPRAVDNMVSCSEVDAFYNSVCLRWAAIGSDATKIIVYNVTIYKNTKMSWTNNAKIAIETLIWLKI